MIKNLLKTILATGVFLSVLMIPAKSQDIGLAFGVVGSTSTFDTTGEEMEGIGTSPTAFDTNGPLTVSKDVDIGSAFIEVLARGDLGGITLGFEYIPGDAEIGAKSRTDADNGDASGEADTGTYEGKAEISGHKSIYRANILSNGKIRNLLKGWSFSGNS